MIKLREIVTPHQYHICLDMDSVLTDFDRAFRKISDREVQTGWEYRETYGRDKFLNIVKNAGLEYWTTMSWMKGGKKLWQYIKSIDPNVEILTAPLSIDKETSRQGKIIWCQNNLGYNVNVIVEDEKYKYSGPNKILIDDLEKNTKPWIEHGGIAIQHINFQNTVSKLHELGL